MINSLAHGPVARGTAEFGMLREYAQNRLEMILARKAGDGLIAKVRHKLSVQAAFSQLNAELAPYGVGITKSGKMVVVPIRSEGDQADPAPVLSKADRDREFVRRTIAATGYVVDPDTGKKLQPGDRYKYGAA